MLMSVKLDYYLIPDTKTNSKWVKDLSIIPKATKLLGSNIGRKLYIISLSNGFLDMTPEAQATKAKIDKWMDLHHTEQLLHSQESSQQNKKTTDGMGEDICKL